MYSKIIKASYRINNFVNKTPLEFNNRLSQKYGANIFLKREDIQVTRSFKIRGSLNKILKETEKNKNIKHIVCASAGNHAQGVAYACNLLNLKSSIFVPTITPPQKIGRIKNYGNKNMELIKTGNDFDECLSKAIEFSDSHNSLFIHPYNDIDIIQGQGTIAHEIEEELNTDIIISCIGGGGLIAGINSFNNNYKIIGAEPKGANSMSEALKNDKPVSLRTLDTFVDGASVRKVGDKTFNLIKDKMNYKDIKIIDNGLLAHEMINLYQEDGIIIEPAGCLSVAALNLLDKTEIEGKNIVCILSGGNNDIMRYPEILEKNLIYLGVKHYYIIQFSQKPKELKKFIINVLGENDDITRFEYIKKTNKNYGNVLVGIETKNNLVLEDKLEKSNFKFKKIDENDLIYSYLV